MWYVPLGLKSWFEKLNVKNVIELDWFDKITVGWSNLMRLILTSIILTMLAQPTRAT